MQEIIDAMLQCQAMWMYLESIFSSEDIIAQMPENGRKFSIVDSYWRTIITETVCWDYYAKLVLSKHSHVIVERV